MGNNLVLTNNDEFVPYILEVNDHIYNQQIVFKFDNNFGASVIRGNTTYGGNKGLFELAVIKFTGNSWEIVYDTPVTHDVLGWLNGGEVINTLRQIRNL